MKVEPVPPTTPTDHNPGEADEGQAYADRLRAVLAAGPLSAPLDARMSKPSAHLQAKQEPDTG